MKKISEKYLHKSGVTAKIWFLDENKKAVRLQATNGRTDFVFNKSKTETIKKIGKTFVEIANFIDKLK